MTAYAEPRLWEHEDHGEDDTSSPDSEDYSDWCLDLSLSEMAEHNNLAELTPQPVLDRIGKEIKQGFQGDLESRTTMDRNLRLELELAMQISEETKTYPFEGASNVKMPLVTTAVLQYMARAYEALYNNGRLVEAKTPSGDENRRPSVAVSCKAVERDIAYQLLKEDEDWDDGMQKVLIAQAVSGNVYKKTYYDPERRKMRSVPVYADRLVVHYYATSFATASRVSHILNYTDNELFSLIAKGVFLELPAYAEPEPIEKTEMDLATDRRHGVGEGTPNAADPTEFIECHTLWDLDGDGYQEPVIVTLRRCDGAVARIVANFESEGIIRGNNGRLIGIVAEATFTKYGFIPSPNGSFYDFGFGRLLYSLNKAVNTSVNQMLDAGKMQNMPRGFYDKTIGDQLAGKNKFAPGEFKPVKLHGVDSSKVFHQLPSPEVSPVLLQLLGMLIQYADRVSGSTEVRAGENPGQNTKVGTMEALIDEGATVFNGIYRRTRLAFAHELEKVFKINKKYIKEMIRSTEREKVCSKRQYDDVEEIYPACSFQYITLQQRLKKNLQVLGIATQMEASHPGSHNMGMLLSDIYDDLIPGTADKYLNRDYSNPTGLPAAPPNPKAELEKAKIQATSQKAQGDIQAKMAKVQLEGKLGQAKEQREGAVAQAEVAKLKAEAIAILEGLKDTDVNHQIALLNALIGLSKHKDSHALAQFTAVSQHMKGQQDGQQSQSGVTTPMAPPTGDEGGGGSDRGMAGGTEGTGD